jgi:hypothetical protein
MMHIMPDRPISVAMASEAKVWSHLIAGIAGLNLTESMYVCLLCLVCVVHVVVASVMDWSFVQSSPACVI